MNNANINNTIIIRPDGKEISDEFIQLFKNNEVKTFNSNELLRIEHPHCAFFKSAHQSGDIEVSRTTLYTPEGRLHIDFKSQENSEPLQLDKYINKEGQLEILLFYLRDLEISYSGKKTEDDFQAVTMPNSPLYELKSFVQDDVFILAVTQYEIMIKHILSQMRNIYNAKIEILKKHLKGKAEYALFPNITDVDIDEDTLEKWHHYYMKKVKLFKESVE